MSKKSVASSLMVFLLMLLFSVTAFGQATSSIQGAVTDSNGAAVVGAQVVVKSTTQNIERTTQTGSSGSYEVPALPPGTYSVQIEMSGFQTQLVSDLVLQVSQNSVQNFSLKVASNKEVVTVEAAAPVIETTTMTVGQTINQRTVQDIPLNGRHFVDLALLVPGTVVPPQNGFLTAPLRGQGSFAFNSAGGREDAVNFMINGINLNDMVQNQVTFQPTINTVSEFKIDNSTYSAESGRNSGSIVNIVTRSGSEQFHGEVYDYIRNSFFDARNAFNPRTDTLGNPLIQAPFKRNQFGGDIGGPIFRGKTYFFLSYEGLRHRQGLTTTANVWSDAQRNDIVAGGNPTAIALMNLVPHANSGNTFVGSATAPVDIDQGTADISHNFSNSDNLHGFYVYQNDLRQEPTQGSLIPGWGDTRAGHRQVLTLNETHVFSASLVNQLRLGANRILITFTPNNPLDPNTLGLGSVLGANLKFVPSIFISDLNGGNQMFGAERAFPQGRGDTAFVAADTVSYIRGKHSFKFGTEWRDFRNDNFNNDPGQLVFNCSLNVISVSCPGGTPAAANVFATGSVSTSARTLGNVANRINEAALDFFAQDSWKITSHMTFELGLRYAWNMSPSEALDRFVNFDPTTISLVRGSTPYAQNNKNFQPRVGFAWDLFHTGNTILRGGYGYQTDQPITGFVTGLTANPPFALPISVAVKQTYAQTATTYNSPIPSSLSPAFTNPNFRNANIQSWNVNVEHQLDRNTGIMFGYFASKGTHLEVDRNVNQLIAFGVANTPGFHNVPFFQLSPTSILPNTRLSNITERDSDGNSNYNALWITANRRMSNGLQFNASYTWSHSSDDVSRNNNGIIVEDSTNIGSSRGDSDFDARHRFVANAIYDLPFKGNRFKSGWEMAPIFSFQSGNPFTIVVPSSTITGVGNTVFPNVIGPIIVTNNPFAQWVLPGAFSAPTTTLGNFGRNKIVGPGFGNIDFALIKNTKVTERLNVQFVANVFDILNHPNYGQPGRVFGSSSFGTITSTRFPTGDSGSSRQLQFAVKLQF